MTTDTVERIQRHYPGARSMFARLGVSVPERDGVKFTHPFRPDSKPSCTIKGDRLYDWSQGDGKGLDAIGVFAAAKDVSNSEAIRLLAEELLRDTPLPPAKPKTLEATKPARPPFHKLESATVEDIAALSKLRTICDVALRHAVDAGHLYFAETKEGRAWVVTDPSRQVCQSRRLDGQSWQFIGSKAWTSVKEHGLAGWPLGAADIKGRERVILCEGGPDWLVAHEVEPTIAVCCMLGAKQSIHPDALPLFKGKAVRVLAHGDDAGADACKRWAVQLTEAGAKVTAIRINFDGAHDLNDCTRLPFESRQRHKLFDLLS